MTYGVATSRAHLDRLDPAARASGEIAWDLLPAWVVGGGPIGMPQFAGRYFLGSPTQAEADGVPGPGSGFCLWAHGEGADPDVPRKIVPLQRSDPDRQTAIGGNGQTYGEQDAAAISQYIDRCVAVGDLELPAGHKSVIVFLEVEDNVALSYEYWSAWATAIFEAVLYPVRLMNRTAKSGVQALLPAIKCGFKFDTQANKFLPDSKVQECLSVVSRTNRRTRCFGFWARRFAGDLGLAQHPFDWTTMGEFEQVGSILMPPLPPLKYRVPVRYLQWFDGPTAWPSPIPAGTLRDSLALLTLSYSAVGTYDPLHDTLTATDWHADKVDAMGNLAEMPVQFGIDKNRDLTSNAACLLAAGVTVSSLPSSGAGLLAGFDGTELTSPIVGDCSLAFRYYSSSNSSNKKDMGAREARNLSAAGLHIGVTWEASFSETATIDDLIDQFLTADRGRTDAVAAFTCAAFVGQTPYTPVYFAIDFPPGEVYKGSLMPPLDDVLTYFKNVQQGYRDYRRTAGSIPYYVGAYAARNVCEMLYRAGLATHFWQPWPPNWGQSPPDFRDNWKPFRHGNAWQVVLENTVPEAGRPDMVTQNQALFDCTSVDIDVAWGDPGTFQVFP